ncbi:MAG: DUF5317 family protein [Bacilli bacterium]
MLQLVLIVLSIIIALLRGGRLQPLPRFNLSPVLLLAIAMEIATLWLKGISPELASFSYVLTLVFLLKNWNYIELRIISIGAAQNGLVVWVNGGMMPVLTALARKTAIPMKEFDSNYFWHTAITSHTVFPLLSDIIFVPYPSPTVISFGDIFVFFGIMLLIQRLLGCPVKLASLVGDKE